MSRPARIIAITGAVLGGFILSVLVACFLVIHTSWFARYARALITSNIEQATGAHVSIGSITIEWTSFVIHIHDVTIHGTEPASSAPFLQVAEVTARLEPFSGIAHLLDIAYVGIRRPRVNLITFADGTTNIPHPRIQKASKTSARNHDALRTVVNLKIGQFAIENGLIQFSQHRTSFHAHGENLRLLFHYDDRMPGYQGGLSIEPLILRQTGRTPLRASVIVPITIKPNAIQVTGATIRTRRSSLLVNVSLENMNLPRIEAGLKTSIDLPEISQSFTVPIYPEASRAPKRIVAELAASLDERNHHIQIQKAQLRMGDSRLQATGTLNGPQEGSIRIDGDIVLAQVLGLLNTSTQASGDLLLSGEVTLDARDQYAINGTIYSRGFSLGNSTTRISGLNLYTPFHADPHSIDLNQLRFSALGGELIAKLFIQDMRQLSLESQFHGFDLPVIAAAATGRRIDYDGVINGAITLQGDLAQKGTTGFNADANLSMQPGHRGVPLTGRILASYRGATEAIDLGRSFVALPHSRLELSGALSQDHSAQIYVRFLSHDLNDLLPGINAVSSKPAATLPITLRTGGWVVIDAEIAGQLSKPQITARAALSHFDLQQHPFERLSMSVSASSNRAVIEDGVLRGKTFQGDFDGQFGLAEWKPLPHLPLIANLTLRDANIADLVATGDSHIRATGSLDADIHIHGTYGDPLGSATLNLTEGSFDQQPFDDLCLKANFAHRLITISPLRLTIGTAQLILNGSFRHPADSLTEGSAEFQVNAAGWQLANLEAMRRENRGIAGLVQLKAVVAANINRSKTLTVSNIFLDFAATGLRVDNQSAGDLFATARTTSGTVEYSLRSNFAGSRIDVNGKTALTRNYVTSAELSIRELPVDKALAIAGENSTAATGSLSANARVSGTLSNPSATLEIDLTHANLFQQPIHRLNVRLQYSNTQVIVPAITLDSPAGGMILSGIFSHPAHDLHAGTIKLNVKTTPIRLGRVELLRAKLAGIRGVAQLAGNVAASFEERDSVRSVRISDLNLDASAAALAIENHALGDANFAAHTRGRRVSFTLNSNFARSSIRGSGEAQLAGEYPIRATLSFANIRYAYLYPFISNGPAEQPRFDALVAGTISANGPLLKKEDLEGQIRLTTVELTTLPQQSPTGGPTHSAFKLQNDGPLVISINHEIVRVQQFHITGPQTTITATGAVDLRNASSPLRLRLNGNANLALLQEIDRDFYSNGSIALETTIHGTPSAPAVTGEIQLKNVNIEYAGFPNGISNANAVILLRGTTAEIASFRGETGGGKVTLSGFASYTGQAFAFNLRANAERVRIFYSGVSVITGADISLTGNSRHSLLGGRVVVDRIAYGSSTDVGSLLSAASAPPSSPSAPSPLIAGMRLDIHVLSSPGLRVVSSYVQTLQLLADLNIRGTAANPGILGSIRITSGTLLFFGNKYTVNVGTVNFYNPYAIQPVLNFSLQTVVQSVSVTLDVSGPMDNLKLNYHSDPPLTFQQIVELLATNTTPSTDPTIAANQPPSQPQSFSQMGESAILSQAVANPVASRLQKVFGISEFKIDPSFQGSNGLPTARITLKQQIMSNLTFTYIEDLSQTNAEIIRVEWDFTPNFSAVATRDWNGIVGLEFLYAFKKR
jgi:translocation and assembly module TamB